MATTTPAQRAAAAQQLQAQYARQYNPSNIPPPGPGTYMGPYFQTADGKWFQAPGAQGGSFVPSAPPPEGFSTLPPPPPAQITLGGPGPRFQMPGPQPWQSGGEGPGGIPSVTINTPDPDLRMPPGTFGNPNIPGTPLPPMSTPKKDKAIDWKKIISTVGSNWKDIASVLTAAAASRAKARGEEAANARNEDYLNLQRAELGIRAPRMRAGQAAYGDLLANYQPIDIHVPGVAEATSEGGWDLGPNVRAAGAELSKQALEKLMSGEDLPELSERPEGPGWVDDLLNYSGIAATGLGIYDRIRNPPPKPATPPPVTPATTTSAVTTPPPTPLPIFGTPGAADWDDWRRNPITDPLPRRNLTQPRRA